MKYNTFGSTWIRILSVAGALLVPAVVAAATVQFRANQLLTAQNLQDVSDRTLDKDRVYTAAAVSAVLEVNAAITVAAPCTDREDILLNCSCTALAGSRSLDLRVVAVTGNDNPNSASTCACGAQNVGANQNQIFATPTCIDLPPLGPSL